MDEERLRQDLLFLAIFLSVVIAGLQLVAIPYMTTTEVLMQDFDLELRMGLPYGYISGNISARAIDMESTGRGNSVVVELSPGADELYVLEATRELGELQIFVQDQGVYSTDRLQMNASSIELLTSSGSSIDELRFSDVNASLITSSYYAQYGIEFNWTEGLSAPWVEITRVHEWYTVFFPYMQIQANGNSSTLLLYGNDLGLSIDSSNYSFAGKTVLSVVIMTRITEDQKK